MLASGCSRRGSWGNRTDTTGVLIRNAESQWSSDSESAVDQDPKVRSMASAHISTLFWKSFLWVSWDSWTSKGWAWAESYLIVGLTPLPQTLQWLFVGQSSNCLGWNLTPAQLGCSGRFFACELAFSLVTLSTAVRRFPSPPAHHPFQAWLRFPLLIATVHEVPPLKWGSRRKEWAGGKDLPRSRWPHTLPNFALTIGRREGWIL